MPPQKMDAATCMTYEYSFLKREKALINWYLLVSSLLSQIQKSYEVKTAVSYIWYAAKNIFSILKTLDRRVNTYKLSTILHTPVAGYDSPGLLKSREMHPGMETCSGKALT